MCLTCCIGAPSSHNSIKAGNSTLHAPTRVAVTYKKCQGSTEHCTNKLTLSHVHTHARTHARRHTHVHTIANTYAPHYTAGIECLYTSMHACTHAGTHTHTHNCKHIRTALYSRHGVLSVSIAAQPEKQPSLSTLPLQTE